LVGAPVALAGLIDDPRAGRARHLRGAVGGGVVDHHHLVDERGHLGEHGGDALLLVVAGDDYGDALASVHVVGLPWVVARAGRRGAPSWTRSSPPSRPPARGSPSPALGRRVGPRGAAVR